MSKKGIYNATKNSFIMYAGFFKDVTQELGLEKALTLHARQAKLAGVAYAAMLHEELGRKRLNLSAVEWLHRKVTEGMGIAGEYKKDRSSLKVETLRCPVYEGCAGAGLDHKTIEMLCSELAAREYEEIKNVYPEFSGCLKFRSTPGEPCTEEFVILK